jgi:N-acetylglutamate synthase-like GNAT family acetyltransferase
LGTIVEDRIMHRAMFHSLPISIRAATPEDVPAIRAVLHSVREEYQVLCEIGSSDLELDDLERNYFARGGSFEVLEDACHRIVGCAGLYPLSEQRAELGKMYLLPQARGRGLGRQLLENMLDAARRSGFREVWIETNSSLSDAIRLYQGYGFESVPLESGVSACDAAYLLRLDKSAT